MLYTSFDNRSSKSLKLKKIVCNIYAEKKHYKLETIEAVM